MASPDEPAHVIKAAAVARGEWLGIPLSGPHHEVTGFTYVRVPGIFNALMPSCYAFRPDVPASCMHILPHPSKDVSVPTGAGRYPPLYYFVVGLPSLIWKSTRGIRLMRVVSGLLCAAFLASAFASASESRRRSFLVWGVAVAMTPMALFLAGTVNPSGLEIAAAICLWTTGCELVLEKGTGVDHRLMARAGVSAAVLVQVRTISPLWMVMIIGTLVLVAGRQRLLILARAPVAWIWAGVVILSSTFALWWLHYAKALASTGAKPPAVSLAHRIEQALGLTDAWLHEMVGVLGWLDTPAPFLTFYGVLFLVALFLSLGILTAEERRRPWILVALAAAVVVVPAYIQVRGFAQVGGLFWQGRYALPLAAGVVILGAGLTTSERLPGRLIRRSRWLFATVFLTAQGAIFVQDLRRYTVGFTSGNPFSGPWHPPFGSVPITVFFAAALVGWTAWLIAISGPTFAGTGDDHGSTLAGQASTELVHSHGTITDPVRVDVPDSSVVRTSEPIA
jgi:hypothetical protein